MLIRLINSMGNDEICFRNIERVCLYTTIHKVVLICTLIVTDPQKIVNLINTYYANICSNIEKNLPKLLKKYNDYLNNIQVGKSFFLNPIIPQEIFDIISACDNK